MFEKMENGILEKKIALAFVSALCIVYHGPNIDEIRWILGYKGPVRNLRIVRCT
jgi:hypothetical protein